MTIDDILGDYADLERDDILAALAFAARLLQVKRFDLIGVERPERSPNQG